MTTGKKFTFFDKNKKAKIISTTPIEVIGPEGRSDAKPSKNPRLYAQGRAEGMGNEPLRLAYVCNWDQHCGISTYSKFVINALGPLAAEYRIFSEHPIGEEAYSHEDGVEYCWKRGDPLDKLLGELRFWRPNFVLIQHEWGVFPDTRYFMSFLLELRAMGMQYAVVMHSVYDHLDKSIPISIMDNVIVHSQAAADTIRRVGYRGGLSVIPHGCPERQPHAPIFNILKTPYSIFGYGFGFGYKGVETAIMAVRHLVETWPAKYSGMLYTYVCSESANNMGIHEQYFENLRAMVKEFGLEKNVILIKGYQTPEQLDVWLRTAKMAVFPYVVEPGGVYGSSGAIKIAMSYNIPVIASMSHLFDDIDGYVARISDHVELADEMRAIFNDSNHRKRTIDKAHKYIAENSWENTAKKYRKAIKDIMNS
jgi:glycosyltransferase involved in cell wall biosynthesis